MRGDWLGGRPAIHTTEQGLGQRREVRARPSERARPSGHVGQQPERVAEMLGRREPFKHAQRILWLDRIEALFVTAPRTAQAVFGAESRSTDTRTWYHGRARVRGFRGHAANQTTERHGTRAAIARPRLLQMRGFACIAAGHATVPRRWKGWRCAKCARGETRVRGGRQ